MTTKKTTWGGARIGAGRPATGRNPRPRNGVTVYLSDDEKSQLNAVVDATGKSKTAIFRDAIKKEFEEIKEGK